MRSHRYVTRALFAAALLACRIQVNAQDFRLIYTGRTFGYYRLPRVQDDSVITCPARGTVPPEEVARFQSIFKGFDPGWTAARVATGDNFAPFVLARMAKLGTEFQDKQYLEFAPGSFNQWILGDAYWESDKKLATLPDNERSAILTARKDALAGSSAIPLDNVACFLRFMQFDSIVPGAFDFYFGPKRLRGRRRTGSRPTRLTCAARWGRLSGGASFFRAQMLTVTESECCDTKTLKNQLKPEAPIYDLMLMDLYEGGEGEPSL